MRGRLLIGNAAEATLAEVPELFARTCEPNIFFAPAWLQAWRTTLGQDRSLAAIEARTSQNSLEGWWPFFEVPAIGGRGLWPAGAHSADGFAPLLAGDLHAAAAALASAIHQALTRYRFLWVPLLPQPFAREVLAPCLETAGIRFTLRARTPNLLLEPPSQDFDAFFRERTSSKSRGNIRRSRESLEAQGRLTIEVAREAASIAALFPVITTIERRSWKGGTRAALFGDPAIRRFYKAALPALAREDHVRLSTLCLDGIVIAYNLCLTAARTLAFHNQAYLPEYADGSPGLHLLLEDLRTAFAARFRTIDFLQGEFAYKRRFATTESHLMDLTCFAPSLSGHANRLLFRLVSRDPHRAAKP